MAITLLPDGFLCYNNGDLIRDGYIYQYLTAEYDLSNASKAEISKWEKKLKGTPRKGLTYTAIRDENGNLIGIHERRRQLPANKIKIEIKFSKTMKNMTWNPVQPGTIPFFGGFTIGSMFGGITFGGIAQGDTYMTYHLCDAETLINKRIQVTETIKNTGIIKFDGYPLSVFGIVKEHVEIDSVTGNIIGKYGLNFTDEQKENIGKYYAGAYLGIPRLDIRGATSDKGQFGIRGEPEVKIEDILFNDQSNLFIEIPRDRRRLKFRADNPDASGKRGSPYESKSTNDITSQTIKINNTDLNVGDILYITISLGSARRTRQALWHMGKVAQSGGFGMIQWNAELKSEVDVFDYQICRWKIPIGMPAENANDNTYKLTLNQYQSQINYEILEGWRVSDANTEEVKEFWAADYRGILRMTFAWVTASWNAEVILDASLISDQNWFISYLENLDFTIPTGPGGIYLPGDLQVKIEDKFKIDRAQGFLFDISEVNNSLLFDREKIPYYRSLALALRNINKYNPTSPNTGVGIPNLDLYDKLGVTLVSGLDLSGAVFEPCYARPRFIDSCDEEYKYKLYYSCHIYDPAQEGRLFFSRDYIEHNVLEWRPSGGTIESYWLLQTPYFCGNFTNKSRIYMEYVGGNSINNFSMIYADTLASIVSTISTDKNNFTDTSFLVFKEDKVHSSIAYHFFKDGEFAEALKYIEVDKNKNHQREEIQVDNTSLINSHNTYKIIGYNNILGDSPSFNYGSPLEDARSKICHDNITDFFVNVDFLDPIYGLDFTDEVPKIDLPKDQYVKKIKIKYKENLGVTLSEDEKYVTLYFDNTGSAINNFILTFDNNKNSTIATIDCKYHYGGPISLLGVFWKNINVEEMTGIIVDSRLINYRIDADQMSVIDDERGRLLIFYANTETSNICVTVSYDMGSTWVNYKDIIRLLDGEIASFPIAIRDKYDEIIHLYYVLNDKFIMYKRINTSLFSPEDVFIEYNPLEIYDINSTNDDLLSYTSFGQQLRKETSYFIVGDASDDYFIEQMNITNNIKASNITIIDPDLRQAIRLDYIGDLSEMKMLFPGTSYTIHINNQGIKRLFFTVDGKLYIKSSGDFLRWKYDVEGVIIHRNFIDEKLEEGETCDIKNIQVVRNYLEANLISILYFHNGMLFIRNLRDDLLNLYYDEEGKKDNYEMVEYLQVTKENSNKPIFLIGNIPDKIKDQKQLEIATNIVPLDSKLAIQILYIPEMIDKMNDKFALDTDTQVFAYTTKEGFIRIFYKDNLDVLNCLIVNGLTYPKPEILYKVAE